MYNYRCFGAHMQDTPVTNAVTRLNRIFTSAIANACRVGTMGNGKCRNPPNFRLLIYN